MMRFTNICITLVMFWLIGYFYGLEMEIIAIVCYLWGVIQMADLSLKEYIGAIKNAMIYPYIKIKCFFGKHNYENFHTTGFGSIIKICKTCNNLITEKVEQ